MKKVLSLALVLVMILGTFTLCTVGSHAQDETLIASGSEWAYNAIFGEGELPENWYTEGFDTSAFTVAPAPFGNKWSNSPATSIQQADDEDLVVGFVKTFTAGDPADYEVLTMSLYYDENVTVYLNGEVIFEKSGYNTSLTAFDMTEYKESLKNGTNTMAVLMHNASTGYGFNFDMELTAGAAPEPPASVNSDGTIAIKYVDKTGFYDFGDVNSPNNLLDGIVDSCSGSGRDESKEQSFTLTFWEELDVVQIYLQCKGYEDNCVTTHEDGVTFGYYDVYVDDVLVGDNVPAVSEQDGGYLIELETPVKGSSVKVEIVDKWLSVKPDKADDYTEEDLGSGNWANLADIIIWNTTDIVIVAPTEISLDKTTLVLEVGKSETLTATTEPADVETGLTWSTDNAGVATVDAFGKVTAVGVGTTILSVVTDEGLEANCVITVTETSEDEPVDPTDKPTDKPTDEPTDEPTDKPTDKPTDEPTVDDAKEDGGNMTVIIIAIVAGVVVLAAVLFFVLKKKK